MSNLNSVLVIQMQEYWYLYSVFLGYTLVLELLALSQFFTLSMEVFSDESFSRYGFLVFEPLFVQELFGFLK